MAGELTRLVVGNTTYLADDWAELSRVAVSSGLEDGDVIALPTAALRRIYEECLPLEYASGGARTFLLMVRGLVQQRRLRFFTYREPGSRWVYLCIGSDGAGNEQSLREENEERLLLKCLNFKGSSKATPQFDVGDLPDELLRVVSGAFDFLLSEVCGSMMLYSDESDDEAHNIITVYRVDDGLGLLVSCGVRPDPSSVLFLRGAGRLVEPVAFLGIGDTNLFWLCDKVRLISDMLGWFSGLEDPFRLMVDLGCAGAGTDFLIVSNDWRSNHP